MDTPARPPEVRVKSAPVFLHTDFVDDGEVRGAISIVPAVLIELIELTVRGTPGLAGFGGTCRLTSIKSIPHIGSAAPETKPSSFSRGGIRVEIEDNRVEADLTIVVHEGTSVPALGLTIQKKVSMAVERMLGMTVSEINVHVVDVEVAAGQKESSV